FGIDAADDGQVVAAQLVHCIGMEGCIGVDPKGFLAAGGECIAGHLTTRQVDLLVTVNAKDGIAAALQLAERCFAGGLNAVGNRHEDCAATGGAWSEWRAWRRALSWQWRLVNRGCTQFACECFSLASLALRFNRPNFYFWTGTLSCGVRLIAKLS